MADAFNIRTIQRDNYHQWLPLWHAYNVFYGRPWGEGGAPPVDPEVTAATWDRFFEDGEPLWALVAEVDGKLVGLVHYLFHRATNFIAPVCYLEDLFTAKAARGKGVGRALIEAVAAEAKAAGVSRVYWMTEETNATARRLYERVAAKTGDVVYRKEV